MILGNIEKNKQPLEESVKRFLLNLILLKIDWAKIERSWKTEK